MSAPEPCPECKGRCCLDELYYPIEHMGAGWYGHDCESCEDGTKYVMPRTALDERRDVLAFLHAAGSASALSPDEKAMINWIARAIFGMEHVGAATKGKP